MVPIKMSNATRVFKAPDNWGGEEPCEDLHVIDYDSENGNVMVSAWILDEEEIQSLQDGGVLYLHVHGKQLPVVSLAVSGT